MEKNRIRPKKFGNNVRMSYSRQKEVLEMPNLIEVQKNSYQWFLDEGLNEAFNDISPIGDYSGRWSLDFTGFRLCTDEAKYTIEECKERDATYAAPLRVKVRLQDKQTGEMKDHEIFMGDLPLMTETGTFVINGAERVIVSQLVRSPGIYYDIQHDKIGKELYSCTVIPNRGAWLEYETDSNDIFYVRVDRTRKVPVTVLIRALLTPTKDNAMINGSNEDIINIFGDEPKLLATIEKDVSTDHEKGLTELYKKIRPGEPVSVDNAESLIQAMFLTLEDMILLRLDVISSIRSLTSEQELQDRHLLKMLLSNRQVRLSLQERLLQERLDRQSRMQLYHMYISRQKSVRLRCFLTLWLMLQSG